jgi:hypothetical protein
MKLFYTGESERFKSPLSLYRRVLSENYENSPVFICTVVSVYFCVLFFNIINHEMWRDELEPWLVVKDSSSFFAIFEKLKYVGHPALWYVLLYPLSRIFDQPVVMQYYHLMFAVAAIYIFLKFSPFERLHKILLVFSYFFLFEYATISKNYILGVLSVFTFCALFETRRKSYVVLSLTLFFLSQSSAFGLMLAGLFGLAVFIEALIDKDIRTALPKRKTDMLLSIFIVLFGLTVSYLAMRPSPDCWTANPLYLKFDLDKIMKTAGTIWQVFFPIPEFKRSFWNTNILNSTGLQAVLSCLITGFSLLLFIRKPIVLTLFVSGTAVIVFFTYFKFYGFLRHFGHLFLLFIVCLWLSGHFADRKIKARFLLRMTDTALRYKRVFITVILSAQLFAGVFASAMDWVYPFSQSKKAAEFIQNRQLDRLLIIGDFDYAVAPITAYINKNIYYPRTDRFGSWIIWNKLWWKVHIAEFDPNIINYIEPLKNRRRGDVLIILTYDFGAGNPACFRLKIFDKAIVKDENYYLYLWKYDR